MAFLKVAYNGPQLVEGTTQINKYLSMVTSVIMWGVHVLRYPIYFLGNGSR